MRSKAALASALSSEPGFGHVRLSEKQCWGWAHRLPAELSSVQKLCDGTLQLPIELLERWVSDAVIDICRLTCAKVKHDSHSSCGNGCVCLRHCQAWHAVGWQRPSDFASPSEFGGQLTLCLDAAAIDANH